MGTIEIDCRICENCDPKKGCSVYGDDADHAVEACASALFVNYKKKERDRHGPT